MLVQNRTNSFHKLNIQRQDGFLLCVTVKNTLIHTLNIHALRYAIINSEGKDGIPPAWHKRLVTGKVGATKPLGFGSDDTAVTIGPVGASLKKSCSDVLCCGLIVESGNGFACVQKKKFISALTVNNAQ